MATCMSAPAVPIGVYIGIMWRQQFTAPPEPDTPLYVVGDIHGRFDLLFRMVGVIDGDIRARGYSRPPIIFVGDYVDRGPQSDRVLSLLVSLKSDPSRNLITLKGNHEDMLLKFLADPTETRGWLAHGGFETMASYGITRVTENASNETLVEGAADLGRAMGSDALDFLRILDLSYKSGNVFVTHAGADPTKNIDEQKPKTLVWGTSKFKTRLRRDGVWVVHGHFAEAEASKEHGRVSLDTGAYFSGKLTAARISPGEVEFMSVEQ